MTGSERGSAGWTPAADPSAAAMAKAATLIEALPWLERLHGKTVVIKFGGHAMADPDLCFAFAQDVVFLRYAGLRPVIVHGGGPQIDLHLDRLGVPSTFRAGLRVTTQETMDVVRMVLTGSVNRDLVGLINRHGPFAMGMSGEDANLLTAARAQATVDGEAVDLGQVGRIEAVDPGAVRALIADGRIPVISSVARGFGGRDLQRQRRHRGRRHRGRARRGEADPAHRRSRAVRGLAAPRRDRRRRGRCWRGRCSARQAPALPPR